ncbi:MAG TPA: multifunctional oxoglutarate decarboxylase/oxoglutarate dehydrogenase thiamine pyrophosphate-binding subunit/dihydrolipoyllysine-residue succinyltransferase subunit [Gemmatimonadales bacterium]|nr:multifunctional oxoglutarate decarboxylase/oxoglutarate dehydrogenase thiamine pyrophosphate-binding subunit/dihydrolipoyllysine-residue succinyltransferase subunit [Gemmatimonadales bacterium]
MHPNVFETANAGFAQALYEDYLRDPASVSPEWRRLFESGQVGERPAPSPNGASPAPNGAGPVAEGTPAAPAGAQLLKGPALRLAQNMNDSLTVPTATTFRELAVTVLDARRRDLNAALAAAGRPTKLSFTHLIAWALVRGLKAHPVMGHSLLEREGQVFRVTPDGIHLGLAVDVERKDGSRGLVVPVLKHAEAMDFAAFHAEYERLVEAARTNKLMPDAFMGATVSLTNPGGLGTSASVPRLMKGQGTIIATGAIGVPAAFAADPRRAAELGVGKVMQMTSTYDHRLIQGAESGTFLRTVDQLLQGQQSFYEEVAAALGVTLPAAGQARAPAPPAAPVRAAAGAAVPADALAHVAAAMSLVKAHRTHGHLAARLDPLGSEPEGDPALEPATVGLAPEVLPTIPATLLRVAVPGPTLAEVLPRLRETYCGTIAYEVEHISSHAERVWLRDAIESGRYRTPLGTEERRALLARLTEVETFERFLHKAYLGKKRFSIEGVDALVPMLDLATDLAGTQGTHEVVIGMAHRGRLNVLVHNVGRPYEAILAEFEEHKQHPEEPDAGTGDVKYHHGADGVRRTPAGAEVAVSLSPNPSHLEFVGPVVDGRARAKQTDRTGAEARHDVTAALPIVIHGDAAFAGQGVVAETLNLGRLRGYGTGGTLHIITNNQVGFTTDMRDSRSTRYASDLAKGFDIPIVHVNADDPEACLAAVRLAMAYRREFANDVLIDLVGYRRHGHNEGDEPGYTQPLMYERIKALPTVRARYAAALVGAGVISEAEAEAAADAQYQKLVAIQQAMKAAAGAHTEAAVPAPATNGAVAVQTALPEERLRQLNEELLTWPAGFTVHPKLVKQLERRRHVLGPEGGIDFGHAEALAFGSLLQEGTPIRLTGQDSERGTFSHRHLVLHDAKTGATFAPLQALPGARASLEVYNSPLSELATMGFEYGYSVAAPETLVLWEGQFGDFVNGAQVILDQFLAAGQSKWGQLARLTLLLPHGYEGQGPEHSSARLERFLQLSAEGNLRVANCTTPAQYFHLLRRQARDARVRPLVIMTPKSLLRLPVAASKLADLTAGTFRPVVDDPTADASQVTRVVLCSGKVYYDLAAEAEKLGVKHPAVIRVEQLYPFPAEELRAVLARYPRAAEVVWAQEEPRNMGAWGFVAERLGALLPRGMQLRYAGRPERASPAEGYPAAHSAAQKALVEEALK